MCGNFELFSSSFTCQNQSLALQTKEFYIFKMGQHENNAQIEIFVKFMEQHSDLARGFVKGDKVYYEQLWEELGKLLNASGPPMKEVPAWKKVWIDMKLTVKQRLAHNRIEVGKTGGGRFNKYVLSPHEEQLAVICGLYASVDGVKKAKIFGAPAGNKNKIIPPTSAASPPKSKETSLVTCPQDENVIVFSSPSTSKTILCQSEKILPRASTPSNSARKRHIVNVGDVMEMEAEHFSKMSCSLNEVKIEIKENREYLREISKNIREIKKIKEKELKELTRHNYIIEKNMQTKNELKLKFLELEQFKAGVLPTSPSL